MVPRKQINRALLYVLLVATILASLQVRAAEIEGVEFQRDVAPLLKQFCVKCHGPAKAESEFRIDQLPAVPDTRGDLEHWSEIAEQIKAGDMPPPKAEQPSVDEVGVLIDGVTNIIHEGAARLKPPELRSKRRLTKDQYSDTLQDLTGIPLQFGQLLPDDSPGPSGFTNDVETLGYTSAHSEQFLATAQAAVERILPENNERPFDPRTDYDFVVDFAQIGRQFRAENFVSKQKETLRRFRTIAIPVNSDDLQDGLFGTDYGHHGRGRSYPFDVAATWSAPLLHRFNARKELVEIELARFEQGMYVAPHGNRKVSRHTVYPEGSIRLARGGYATRGWAKISVTAAAEIDSGDSPPDMFVTIRLTEDLDNRTVQRPPVFTAIESVNAPVDQPRTYSFFVCLDNLGLLPQDKAPKQEPTNANGNSPKKVVDLGGVPPLISVYNGKRLPGDQDGTRMYPAEDTTTLLIKSVAIQWPCEPPTTPAKRLGLNVPETSDPETELAALRPEFDKVLQHIWRSNDGEPDSDPVYNIYRAAREADQTPRQALRDALTVAFCSPHFLYLDQSTRSNEDGHLTDEALAVRLSYFLWNSLPDQRLMDLAAKGQLADPDVRAKEAERMLADPRSDRFINQFMDQWMMRGLDGVAVDTDRFDEFSEAIRADLRTEGRLFFGYHLRQNLPITSLLDAQFRILNHDLAKYYGIDFVSRTNKFEKVEAPPAKPTAGLLTLGAPLIIRGTGRESSPFARGAWVLTDLLGTPPPSPPPSVPELPDDPEFEKLPLREKFAAHRNAPSCASCHTRIDPWGIALERYDASGRRRSRYVDLSKSTISQQRNVKSKFVFGQNVLSEAALRDGTPVNDVTGVRDAILKSPRRGLFLKHMARLLLSYSMGRSLTVKDEPSLKELTDSFGEGEIGLRSAIIQVVRHRAFARP